MNINDLLQALTASQGKKPAAPGNDPLAGILGGLLGGAGASAQPGAAGDDPLAGILGGLLGGAGASAQPDAAGGAGTGGLAQILVQVLGGNKQFAGIIEGLAAKIGLPPAIAQTVVTFVLEKLLGGSGAQTSATATRKRQPATPTPGTRTGRQRKPTAPDSGALRDMFQQGTVIDASYLKRSGLAKELAQRTGMNTTTATQSLEYAFGALQGRAVQMSGESGQVTGLTTDSQGHPSNLPATSR